jgi:hypothetical protein
VEFSELDEGLSFGMHTQKDPGFSHYLHVVLKREWLILSVSPACLLHDRVRNLLTLARVTLIGTVLTRFAPKTAGYACAYSYKYGYGL